VEVQEQVPEVQEPERVAEVRGQVAEARVVLEG
jgi:hypothetical protein